MEKMNLGEVLDLAIGQEVNAHRMYLDLAGRVQDPAAKDALSFMAGEEGRHRDILVAYRKGKLEGNTLGMHDAVDARLVEAFGSPIWNPAWKPEEVFLMASQQEKVAHEFYQKLADLHPPGKVRDLLLKLSKEELGHKEKMEYLYANTAYPQTDGG